MPTPLMRFTLAALAGLSMLTVGCEPPEGNIQFGETTGADVLVDTDKDGSSTGDSCNDNSDCGDGSYCAKTSCGATEGVCQVEPAGCGEVYLPVCGCDSKTYGNACEAAAAGVNVAKQGTCDLDCTELGCPPNSVAVDTDGDGCPDTCQEVGPGFCQSNSDCAATEFCDGPCGQPGKCTARPDGCFYIYAPVCGCDGKTYASSCEANKAGVASDYDGECKVDCPTIGCPPGQVLVDSDGDGCGETCIPESDACVPDVQFADAPAAPFIAPSCGPDEFCQATSGTCGADGSLGVCVSQSNGCPDNYDPVCGCDGKTYGNSCEAVNAGAQKLHDGECKTCDLTIDCAPGYSSVDTDGDGCDDTCVPNGLPCGGADPFACGPGQFCESNDGSCPFGGPGGDPTDPSGDAAIPWAPGTCVEVPQICPDVYAPVCGCDGVTYGNDCERRSAMASKEHDGACKNTCPPVVIDCPEGQVPYDSNGDGCVDACQPAPSGCLQNAECPQGSYCAQPGCIDGPGVCEPIPDACLDIWDPVCGCDGQTYGNGCEAASAGVSVASSGECGACDTVVDCLPGYEPFDTDLDGCDDSCLPVPNSCGGFVGSLCPPDQVCDPFEGQCGWSEAAGLCVPKAEACDDVDSGPVCGCNGQTYANDCERIQAGVSKDHDGTCGPCVPVGCPAGQTAYDSNGDGCADACQPGCPELLCPVGYEGYDIDGDGCPDECVEQTPCDTGFACPNGGVALDSDGDGCKDQCVQGAPCGGADSTFSCGPDQFCELDAGVCSPSAGDGACMTPPDGCFFVYAPVCGCDGETYENDCFRQSEGVAKLSDGPCDDATNPGTP